MLHFCTSCLCLSQTFPIRSKIYYLGANSWVFGAIWRKPAQQNPQLVIERLAEKPTQKVPFCWCWNPRCRTGSRASGPAAADLNKQTSLLFCLFVSIKRGSLCPSLLQLNGIFPRAAVLMHSGSAEITCTLPLSNSDLH